jgi:hypothetical protein
MTAPVVAPTRGALTDCVRVAVDVYADPERWLRVVDPEGP